MEQASQGIHAVLSAFTEEGSVEKALLNYVARLELDYADVQDITLFVFALRSFFCWHRAEELKEAPEAVARVREKWITQNDRIYTDWLSSVEDDPSLLRWAKWTFQAKNTILSEFLSGRVPTGAGMETSSI